MVRSLGLWLCLSTCVSLSATVDISVKNGPKGTLRTIQVLQKGSTYLAPVTAVAEIVGLSWQWDMTTERLVCVRGGDSAVFVQDNSYCRVSGRTVPLAVAPLRSGGQLFLPLGTLLELLGPLADVPLQWSPERRTLTFRGAAHSITSLTCTQDSTATVVRLTLADSLPFSLDYEAPRLVLEFARASLDTSARRQPAACGVVDSIQLSQVGETARVELVLGTMVDSPEVKTAKGGHSVTVRLRSHPRRGPVPDSLLSTTSRGADTIATVVIDAGHGGKDPGAIGPGGIMEKDIALSVALKLRDLLKRNTRLKVQLTRDSDRFLELYERTKFANEKKADVFISLHANAVPGSDQHKLSVRGYKMYFLSQAKNEEDKLVAMQENAVVELEDRRKHADYLQNVITQMVGTEYLKESQDLSILLAESFASSLRKLRKLQTGVGQANFYVLNGAYMPSVLIEMGFISNVGEEQLLANDSFQNEVAQAIFDALNGFRKKYEAGL
jgi:N-acetylmuramoyl-L-alanine amidase